MGHTSIEALAGRPRYFHGAHVTDPGPRYRHGLHLLLSLLLFQKHIDVILRFLGLLLSLGGLVGGGDALKPLGIAQGIQGVLAVLELRAHGGDHHGVRLGRQQRLAKNLSARV